MADESLDRLSIEIKASADGAARSIRDLNSKLSTLSTSLSKIRSHGLGNSYASEFKKLNSAINGVNTSNIANIERLAKSFAKFNRKNVQGATTTIPLLTQQIVTMANALNGVGHINFDNVQLSDMISSLGKLGGVNIQRATQIMPQFTRELMNMFNTLSQAPQIAGNTIQMTNALGNLANSLRGNGGFGGNGGNGSVLNGFAKLNSGIHKVERTIKRSAHSIKRFYTQMHNLQKKTIDVAAAFGKFYATYWLALRAIKGVWGITEKAMSYVETLNYFDETMKQIISRADLSPWEDLGYESAKAYADSFYDNAIDLFTKVSGYSIAENGRLVNAMTKSLGLDPQAVMSAYTQFAQMSSSMGIASNTATKMAQALTLIGTDLSSIRDVAFDDTWNALSSGLTGTARALDKYGVNLRISGLNQELMKLGIDATANSLSQADRAILRTITILDSGEFAWADLIETIDTGANRLRVLQASTSNLSRTLGQIFLPIVAKVLPYVTALVNALQRLAEWFVTFLGFDDFDWGGFGDVGDIFSDIADAADDADSSVTNLKDNIQGFDKLNILKSSSGNGSGNVINASGLLDAALDEILNRYLAEWNGAYDGLEQRTQEFADNVQRIYRESGLYGVGRYFADSFEDALRGINWDSIWSGASNIGSGSANFLNGLISPSMFASVGETIANAIKTAILGALSFTENFDWSNLGTSIATGINSYVRNYPWQERIELSVSLAHGIAEALNKAIDDIDANDVSNYLWGKIDSILEGAFEFVTTFEWEDAQDNIKEIFNNIIEEMSYIDASGMNGWQKLGATVGGLANGFMDLLKAVPWLDVLNGAKDAFKTALSKFWEENPNLTELLLSIGIAKTLGKAAIMAKIASAIGGGSLIAGGTLFLPITLTIAAVVHDVTKMASGNYKSGASILLDTLIQMEEDFEKSGGYKTLGEMGLRAIKDAYDYIYVNLDMGEQETRFFGDFMDRFSQKLENMKEKYIRILDEMGVDTSEFKRKATDDYNAIDEKTRNFYNNKMLAYAMQYERETHGMIFDSNNLKNAVVADTDIMNGKARNLFVLAMNQFKSNFSTNTGNMALSMEGLKTSLNGSMDEIGTKASSIFSTEKWTFNGVENGLETTFTKASDRVNRIWSDLMSQLSGSFTLRQSADNAMFSYWNRSNIPSHANGGIVEDGLFYANHNELVGRFSNGRTAVANNDQIVAGIEQGVYRAVSAAMQNGNTTVVLEGDAKGLFKVVRKEANDYFDKNGQSAFSY